MTKVPSDSYYNLKNDQSELEGYFHLPHLMVGTASSEGYFKKINGEWEKRLGFTSQEILSRPWLDFVHPEDHEQTIKAAQQLNDGYDVVDFHNRYRCKDGRYIWLDWSVIPKGDKYYCIARDITRIKEAEHIAQKAVIDSAYLAAIVNSSTDAIISTDNFGNIKSWNDASTKMFGFEAKEILGKNIKSIIPVERSQEGEEILKTILKGKSIQHFETERITKTGQKIFVSLSVSPIKDLNGVVIGKAKILRDISEKKMNEEMIRRSEKKFRSFFNSNLIAIILWKENGEVVDANDHYLNLIGYTRQDLLEGRLNWKALTPPEYKARDEESLIEIQNYGVCKPIEKEYIRKDGSRIPILLGAASLGDGSGMGLCYVIDITDRKSAEQKVQENERSFRDLADSMPQIVWINDKFGKNEYFNSRYYDFTGYDPETVNDRPKGGIVHEDDRDRVVKLYEQSLADQKPYDSQLRMWDYKRKEYRWFISRTAPAFDKFGNIVKWYGTATDIHDQKMLELEQQKLISLVENTPDFVILFDKNHKVVYSNRIAQKKLGLDSSGNQLDQILTDAQGFREKILPIISTQGNWEGEVDLYNPVEKYSIVTHTHSFLIKDTYTKNHIVTALVSRDISEIKSAEIERMYLLGREQAARESSRLKSEFLAHMSHEIRTPINGIIGMTSLLMKTNLDSNQSSMLNSVYLASESLGSVIEDILDLSKIEAGKLELEIIDFNFPGLVRSLEANFSHLLLEKFTKLNISLDEKIPSHLRGDPNRLKQIFNNLISNAIKFSNGGEIFITGILNSSQGGKHSLRLEVRDQGIGISEIDIKKLFKPFSQADSSTSRKYGGSGLGLSICHHLTTMMGGNIGVESIVGKGSTFWFEVALEEAVNNNPAPIDLAPEFYASLKGIKVLVAEDNLINQKVISMMLNLMEATVLIKENGQAVLDALRSGQEFDVVLMDVQMPIMDGHMTTVAIRSSATKFAQIPIIAITANAFVDEKLKCFAHGMNDYITKPMNMTILSETILKHVSPSIQLAIATRMKIADPTGELYPELVRIFKSNTPLSLKLITDSLASRDFAQIEFEVHKLKSNALGLGFNLAGFYCQQIEELLRSNLYGLLEEKLQQLEKELNLILNNN